MFLLENRKIYSFYFFAYLITWVVWSPYYLSVYPLSWLTNPLFHFLGSYGPSLSALLCTYLFEGKEGLKSFAGQIFSLKRPAFIVMAFLLPFLILLISVLIVFEGQLSAFQWNKIWLNKELGTTSPMAWFLINTGIYGLGEEVGWRGYALQKLQSKFNALVSTLIISVLWALWHWPLFFYPNSGYYTMDIASAMGWVFSIVTGSIILTWIFNSSRGSIMACAFFHGTMEVAFTASDKTAEIAQYSGISITVLGVLVLLFSGYKKLSLSRSFEF